MPHRCPITYHDFNETLCVTCGRYDTFAPWCPVRFSAATAVCCTRRGTVLTGLLSLSRSNWRDQASTPIAIEYQRIGKASLREPRVAIFVVDAARMPQHTLAQCGLSRLPRKTESASIPLATGQRKTGLAPSTYMTKVQCAVDTQVNLLHA